MIFLPGENALRVKDVFLLDRAAPKAAIRKHAGHKYDQISAKRCWLVHHVKASTNPVPRRRHLISARSYTDSALKSSGKSLVSLAGWRGGSRVGFVEAC